jgi:hypothetical protein
MRKTIVPSVLTAILMKQNRSHQYESLVFLTIIYYICMLPPIAGTIIRTNIASDTIVANPYPESSHPTVSEVNLSF